MHDAYITLKSGEEIQGPIWEFKPMKGYLSMVVPEANGPRIIYFQDIERAIQPDTRISMNVTQTVDLLYRAKQEGWEP
jgi:hypothetical protein